MRTLVALALTASLAACVSSSASTPVASPAPVSSAAVAAPHTMTNMPAMIPDGTYSTVITRADAISGITSGMADTLSGTWTLTMTGPRFVARLNGAEVVRSEYHSIPDQQVHFPDNDEGPMACHMDGVYRVTVAGHQVTYAKVRDECTGRAMVLTAHPFTMQM